MFKNTKLHIKLFALVFVSTFLFNSLALSVPVYAATTCPDGYEANVSQQIFNANREDICRDHKTGGPEQDSKEAQGKEFEGDCKAEQLDQDNCGIISYIVTIINVLSALVAIVVVLMIAVGGVEYSTARDNPQATQKAKQRIFNALLALVAYFMMYGVLNYLIPGGLF